MSRRARWLDLGELDAAALHGAYAGIAEVQAKDAAPLLLWARCAEPHLSLGASQSLDAEIDVDACAAECVPVLRRALGGGTVFVDHDQLCVFVILPQAHAPKRHGLLFERCLAPLALVYQRFGLDVERVGVSDLWLGERKLLGSGAATLGSAMVFGSSFLLSFPAARFAALMRAPSPGYRHWLGEELDAGMSCWSAHAAPPAPESVARALRAAVGESFGWHIEADAPSSAERAAMQAAHAETLEALEEGRPLVENGIKINHHSYLIESRDGADLLRMVIRRGRIERIACEPTQPSVEQAVLGCEPEPARLAKALAALADGQHWAQRIAQTAAGVRRVYG